MIKFVPLSLRRGSTYICYLPMRNEWKEGVRVFSAFGLDLLCRALCTHTLHHLSFSLSLPLPPSLYISLSLSITISHSHSLYPYLSVCLSICFFYINKTVTVVLSSFMYFFSFAVIFYNLPFVQTLSHPLPLSNSSYFHFLSFFFISLFFHTCILQL